MGALNVHEINRSGHYIQMEQHIFGIFIDYRVHRKEGVAIYNATQVTLQQKPWFCWTKNVFLNNIEGFNQ